MVYHVFYPCLHQRRRYLGLCSCYRGISPSEGSQFWGIADLNGNCGGSGFETISLPNVDISQYDESTFSFDYNVFGFDNGDDIKYQLFYDDVAQSEVVIVDGSSNFSTSGWETESVTIPGTVDEVRVVISIKQNGGSDYAGIDNIILTGTCPEVPCSAPTTLASGGSATATGETTAEISYTKNEGDGTIAIASTSPTAATPTSETALPSVGDAFQGGTVVYAGIDAALSNQSITGLNPATAYYIHVFEYETEGSDAPCYSDAYTFGTFTTWGANVAFSTASTTIDENTGSTSVKLTVSDNTLSSDASVRVTYTTNDASNPSVTDGDFQDVTLTARDNNPITIDLTIDDNFVCDNTTESITLSLSYLGGDGRVTLNGQNTHTVNITENEEAPSNQVSSPTASNVRSNEATLSWAPASDAYATLVALKEGNGVSIADPVSGTTYTASATFNNGQSDLGTGAYVMYANPGSSVTVSGLSAGNTYTAEFYAYNGDNCYNTSSPVQVVFTTTETSIGFEQTTATLLEGGDLEVCLTIANNDNGSATEVTLAGDASQFTGTKTVSFPANSNAKQCVTLTHNTSNSTCDSYTDVTLTLTAPTNGAIIGSNSELDVSLEDDEFYLPSATLFSQDFESGTPVNYTLSDVANTTDDPDDGNVFNGAEDGEYIWDFSSNAINTGDIGISSTTGVYWLIEDPVETGGFGSEDANEPSRTAPLSMLFNNVDMGTANAYKDVEVSFYSYFDTPGDFTAGDLQYGITFDGSEPTSYSNTTLANGTTVIGVDDSESQVRLKLLANYDGDDRYSGWDNITITGKQCVSCNQPTEGEYTSTVSNTYINATSATINFSGASADGVLIIARENNEVSFAPTNRTSYTANNTFGSGSDLGSSQYAVYEGSGSSFTLSGLTEGETYYLKIYDYNNHAVSGEPCYGISGSITTYEFTHVNGAITYTYVGANGSANFSAAANWSPNRVTTDATDKLLFLDGTDVDLTDVSNQTLTHIGVYGDATVGLQGSSASETITITASGADSAEVFVAGNATLKGADSDPINFNLSEDVTAEIAGIFAPNGGNLTLSNALTLSSGAALTFTSGDLTNNGTITVEDDASLIQGTGSTLSGAGTYNITRNRPDGQATNLYNFWSTPLSSEVLMSELSAARKYQLNAPGTSTSDWTVVAGSTALEIGRGYALTGIASHTFSGTVNNGTLTIAASRDQTTGLEFNVIGNPYPSAINALDFCTENSSIVDGYISLFNHNDALEYNSANQQITINNLGATVAGETDEEQTLSNTYIASCQGFYTPLLDNVDGDLITFTNAMRGGDNSDFKSTSNNGILGKFWLHLVNGNREYTTLIGMAEDATWSYDWGWDVKTTNTGNFFINSQLPNAQALSIQTVGPLSQTAAIPLGVAVPTLGDYQIRLRASNSMDFGELQPYLLDAVTHETHSLLDSPYSFSTQDQEKLLNRFFLVFRKANFTTHVDNLPEQDGELTLFRTKQTWTVSATHPIKSVYIYSATGQQLLAVEETQQGVSEVTISTQDIPRNTVVFLTGTTADGARKTWTITR